METLMTLAMVNLFMWLIVAACITPVGIILLGFHILQRIDKWEKK